VLVVQGGINDVAQEVAPATAAANVRAMLRDARTLVPAVLVADVLPWNNGWPDAYAGIRELNHRLSAIASEEHVVLLPFHATLEDPARPGRMRADCAHADGDHPSVEGYRLLGELVARTLARLISLDA
jgi:lysophospholipase L1-like esterase